MSMAALLLFSFVILGSSFAILAYRFSIQEKEETLESNASIMSSFVSTYVFNTTIIPTRTLDATLLLTSKLSGNHIVIVDTEGKVITTSDTQDVFVDIRVGAEQMRTVLLENRYAGTGTLGGLYLDNYFSVGKAVVSASGATVGAVFVSTSADNLQYMIYGFIRLFLFSAAVVLLGACALAYMSAQRMSSPLKLTAAAAREFARGNLSVRVNEDVPEQEVRELAVSFNNMASALEKTEERRREFIANVSHELKTPMTSIGGYVDGILDGVVPEEKREEYLGVVSSEVKRLNRLVNEMLEISRMESQTVIGVQNFDLCECTRRVIAGQERRINEKKLDIDMEFDEAVEVLANFDSITRVIYNLLDNAVKYSYENTVISITIEKRAGKALFSITDEGKPISPDEQEMIFERFHKTDRSRRSEGLGLGLYLVKSILLGHKENVWCEGDGPRTTMRFTLQLAQGRT
jgi:signal transduction histidine kinase